MTNLNESFPADQGMLANAPLDRVLAQLRWPDLTTFNIDDVAESMSSHFADKYPLKRKEDEVQVVLSQSGASQEARGTIYRLFSADETWSLSFGTNFLAIETTEYRDHRDFIDRLIPAFSELLKVVQIPVLSRVGYRYTNRIIGEGDLSSLSQYFNASVLGGYSNTRDNAELLHSITESVYRLESSLLLVRSAQLGANEAIDPTIEPVNERSWILDIDAYEEGRFSSEVERVGEQLNRLSGIGSGKFREVVTPEFYERYDR